LNIKSNIIKIRSAGTEFFHADGRTDRQTECGTGMTKLIVAFRTFPNTPRNVSIKKWCMFYQELTHTRLSEQCSWKAKVLSDMKLCRWVNSSRSFEE
jgi:hypothetical protein